MFDIDVIYGVWKFLEWAGQAAYRTMRYSLLRLSAQTWPTTEALVQLVLPDPPDSLFGIQIEYEYCLDGRYYSGVLLRDTWSKEQYVRHFIARQRYLVRYDPQRPERSYLPLDASPAQTDPRTLA